jgi:hypothetical protein
MKNTELRKRINILADEMREAEMPPLTSELFGIFEKNGNRLEYENVYFLRRKFLAVYGISGVLNRRREDIEKLEYVLLEICGEMTWALPAHCNTVKRPDTEKEIDLFNCETAGALAEVIKETGSLLKPDIVQKVKEEISRRVLRPFAYSTKKYNFEHAKHNWNAVCCGSIGTALINLGNECLGEKMTVKTLNRINDSLETFVNSFPGDGACLEGLGYFNYGISFLTSYARRYKAYAKDTPGFLKIPKLARVAAFPNSVFFKNGISVNFSDATEKERLHVGTLEGLQELLGTPYFIGETVMADFDTDPCYRFLPLLDDVKYGEELKTEIRSDDKHIIYLKDAQWVIAENGAGAGFAIKGGCNGEPHNHNDLGSYIYFSDNKVKACELGAGEYTADYFGEKRYAILCNDTRGHSLPLVNGKGQETGGEIRVKSFEVTEDKENVIVKIDLTGCYEDAESIQRTAVFELNSGSLKIEDRIETDGETADRIISKSDISGNIELLSEDLIMEKKIEIFNDHEGIKKKIYIFELKEKKDGDSKERDNRKRLHCYAYRLHS